MTGAITGKFQRQAKVARDSNAGSPANGITIGASGSGGPWHENASRIGTGIKFGGTVGTALDMTAAAGT
ncbi:hypothetical protein JQ625_06820 [Bradyrhizobium diazoefficiens]|nr:hypothetical protein [Bradyrhizobium diazoefficiens]MBR0774540.1 hypothetical protein [Bradyrhizobium diazoefficiens]